ncbi:MAG: PQQ-dependent sugar dehydrogenase, partial [Actinobacteria bacterium]|nr:PQQ-dependent sugar dehydrogenase [Actinomycetota bacterium]
MLATSSTLFLDPTPATAVPSDFAPPEPIYTGLDYPTNLEFAPNGRVFIAEKDGVIRTASSIGGPLSVFADLQDRVHNFWDRGLLGLAVHPDFPDTPHVYVVYAYGVPLPVSGGPEQSYGDSCPTPPGPTTDGCVVSARLSRITTNPTGDQMVSETVLINDWCQQFPSHSIGDVQFGPDGALYVSAGDGASFTVVDYGQLGGSLQNTPPPPHPCGGPTVEGGAQRAQALRTDGGTG